MKSSAQPGIRTDARVADGVDGEHDDREPDVVRRPDATVARRSRVRTRLERFVAEPPAVPVAVVVGDVEIAVRDEALGDHQIVRLVAGVRELAVSGQRPDDQEEDRAERRA